MISPNAHQLRSSMRNSKGMYINELYNSHTSVVHHALQSIVSVKQKCEPLIIYDLTFKVDHASRWKRYEALNNKSVPKLTECLDVLIR